MKIAFGQIPFSAYGTWFAVSKEKDQIWIRDVHGGDEAPSRLYLLRIQAHEAEDMEITCSETELVINSRKTAGGCVRICYDTTGHMHVLAEKLVAELTTQGSSYDTLVPLSGVCVEHHLYEKQRKVMLTCLSGHMRQEQEWTVRGSHNAAVIIDGRKAHTHIIMQNYKTVPTGIDLCDYEEALKGIQSHFDAWCSCLYPKTGTFRNSSDLASYLTWANTVRAEGCLSSDAMYMTKNVMYNIWSWDNCFGSIALSKSRPDLAYGQLRIFMDLQDKSGCYPDYVNDTFASYNCVKPPIHGWAYGRMMEKNPVFTERVYLEPVYRSLCSMTEFWLNHRMTDQSVFPVYYHGNDSGWDNASVFKKGMPVESPDLAAFLIRQMDQLAEWADLLGLVQEQKLWKEKADRAYEKFADRFLCNGELRARYTPTDEFITEGNSLLPYMSLIIAYRMDKSMAEGLTGRLQGQFEHAYGLATEAPASPSYRKGGYWLGPLWAPVTYILIDTLRSNGYGEFAQRLAKKFCRATETGCMAENFDPFTGEGYDDPGFSWSACVFLTLMDEYEFAEE